MTDVSPRSPDVARDIEEFPLLLCRSQANALIEIAAQQGLTAAQLVRRLIAAYLLQAHRSSRPPFDKLVGHG